MRAPLLFALAAALAAQSAPGGTQAPEVSGKDLQKVTGPFVDRYCGAPGYRDPAFDPGASSFRMQIRADARRSGDIPAVALPEGPVSVKDMVGTMAGWKAYRIDVPPGAKVHARVYGDHAGWFVVRTVNRMGNLEKGMLQNLIPTGNPEASYTNPKKEANTIFFVVDTTQTDSESEPYKLVVDWPKPEDGKAKGPA